VKIAEQRKMNQNKIIKFSHEYIKLININHEQPVLLLEVFEKIKDKMSLPFINYDTSYIDSEGLLNKYQLVNGEYLVLLFADFLGNLFTTVRPRYNKEGDKLDYYLRSRGEKFKVVFDIQETISEKEKDISLNLMNNLRG
jgi:hypothetical protein